MYTIQELNTAVRFRIPHVSIVLNNSCHGSEKAQQLRFWNSKFVAVDLDNPRFDKAAEVFGARAVVAPRHHSAPETGALAKTASGALERQPYLKVTNLAEAMDELKTMGYVLIGLDGEGTVDLGAALADAGKRAVALVLGAEGPGLREKTRETCDVIARIPFAGAFGSLNVSNAAAVGLYAASTR